MNLTPKKIMVSLMAEIILDQDKRLSQSLLWTLQYEAYCQFGVGAWSQKGVPSYITSNSYTTKCYAHIVLGYLRDLLAQNALDLNHPIYLFDLGAGTGRFAYLFLKELFCLIGNEPFSKMKLRYIMTDIATENIDFWQKHPYLKSYYEQGVLDCAQFLHSQSQPLHLIRQNMPLTVENVVNPIVVIANYFFDTIPQDFFRIHNGILEEGRITLSTHKDTFENSQDPNIINHLKFQYSYHPLSSSSPYYEDADDNAILEMYRRQFNEMIFLFPCGACQVLRTFRNLSRSRMLLLAGDQGVCTEKQVQRWKDPSVALHGSFSIAVNYHAIAALIHRLKGKALMTTFSDPAFVVFGAILHPEMDNFYDTELAFRKYIDDFEPTEYWRFVTLTEREWKEAPLDHMLILIKLGNWDAMSLHAFYPRIKELLPKATESQKERLIETIHRVWENYYPVAPEEEIFVANLATLFLEMGLSKQATIYFQRAQQIAALKARMQDERT